LKRYSWTVSHVRYNCWIDLLSRPRCGSPAFWGNRKNSLGVSLASVPPGMSELSLRKVQPKVKVKKKSAESCFSVDRKLQWSHVKMLWFR